MSNFLPRRSALKVNFALAVVLALNILLWVVGRDVYVRWQGVPPVPTKQGTLIMSLGDPQFSYRFGARVLQSLGDGGGHYASLKDYDYKELGRWFDLLDDLDPASNDVPMVAAYYFGSTRVPDDAAVVVNYLARIGQNPVGNKWRWLAQAIFLERFRVHDKERALDLAYILSRMQPIGDVLPPWARHIPVFVLRDLGENGSARESLEKILLTEDLRVDEERFIYYFLKEQLSVPQKELDSILQKRKEAGLKILKDNHLVKPLPALEP